MNILEKPVYFEETIKGSRFLSELLICNSQTEAREILKAQKEKYSDSTHVCHAFICGNNKEIMGMSDDGEPSGTAGRPILDVLKGSDCTNCILTVTRWFGGTLLGTGGLVKAYINGAKSVIKQAKDQNIFSPLILKKQFSLEVDYSKHKLIKKLMQDFTIFNIEEIFETNVKISGYIAEAEYNAFNNKLNDVGIR